MVDNPTIERGIRPEAPFWPWDNRRLIELSTTPAFLTAPAKGKFSEIEEALKQQGLQIPDNWQVQNMLAALAIAGAKVLEAHWHPQQEQKLTTDMRVGLITNPYFERNNPAGKTPLNIGVYFVIGPEQDVKVPLKKETVKRIKPVFIGTISTPDHQSYYSTPEGIGIPNIRAIDNSNGREIFEDKTSLSSRNFKPGGDFFINLVEAVKTTIEASEQKTLAAIV